jgi:EAL domain-containing protein (putative c-di-GMP-specific phosphodiesterase class I)
MSNKSEAAPIIRPIRKAFIIEDDPRVCVFLADILMNEGFVSHQFTRLADIEAALAQRRPEIIVLDLSLGGSDAVETIRSLSAARFLGQVLIVSGHDQATIDEVREIGSRHGLAMLPSLHKPFKVQDFKDRLALVVSHDQAAQATDFETALQNNWLELLYQPKIDLASMLICGAEALLRLRHPERGVLLPSEFLPPPGDPLYMPLTDFVVRRALADWSLLAAGGITNRLAINVPASVLQSPDFVANLRRHLPTNEKFPGLIVEITEDEAISDPDFAREVAVQLKLYNIHIAIDDFGAGYSSLARLRELPFAELKLDRKFVSGCAVDDVKQQMCRNVLELAHRSNILAVAEGVETPSDLKVLIDLGYDIGQGFLFAKAMERSDFSRAVTARALNA